jgi:hypothetical protein
MVFVILCMYFPPSFFHMDFPLSFSTYMVWSMESKQQKPIKYSFQVHVCLSHNLSCQSMQHFSNLDQVTVLHLTGNEFF